MDAKALFECLLCGEEFDTKAEAQRCCRQGNGVRQIFRCRACDEMHLAMGAAENCCLPIKQHRPTATPAELEAAGQQRLF